MPRKLYNTVLGKHLDFKTRLFHALCLIGFVLTIVMSVIYILFGFLPSFYLPTVIASLFPLTALILSTKSNHSRMVRYVFSLLIFLGMFPVLFFLNGGIMSGTPTFFIFAVVLTVLLLDGKHRFIAAGIEIIWYCFFVAIELLRPELVIPFESDVAAITDMTICFVIVSVILAVSVSIRFDSYEKERRELEEAKSEAISANKAKSEFLAKMSHEIRTPMNAIVGMAELSLRESNTPEAKQYAAGIKQASANLLAIINDILDFSKIESGKLEITDQKYQLASLINDVISIIRMRVADKSLLFVVNIDPKLPAELIGDEIRIRQILLNLLGNAVKYTKEGYIKLIVGGYLEDEHTAKLNMDIIDTGIGIKEEHITNLFAEFVQFDLLKNRGIEGTGLGLAITKSLCVAMGGGIEASSLYGVGSIFTVTLPQKYDKYEPLAAIENKEQRVLVYEPREVFASSIVRCINDLGVFCRLVKNQSELYEALQRDSYSFLFFSSFLYESIRGIVKEMNLSVKLVALSEYDQVLTCEGCISMAMPIHSISAANILNDVLDDSLCYDEESGICFIAPKARILIVDDIVTNLKVAEGLLAPFEMQIDICESGLEAIELVSKAPYDIVFMDHMMPKMDGIEATQNIRALDLPYAQTMPIVALTANAVSGVKEMFLKSGFDDFLSKPIEMSKLVEVLERYIPKEKRERTTEIAAGKEKSEIPFELSGVDIACGITTVGGSTEQYISILRVLLKEGESKLNKLADCLEQNNLKLYTTHVHALKSVLLSIGAEKLSNTAKSLECAGIENNADYIRETHGTFAQELTALLAEITAVVGDESVVAQRKELSYEEWNAQLLLLKTALQDYNATKISSALDVLRSGCEDTLQETLLKIEQHVAAFEYEEAEQLIDDLNNMPL